jgi:excisionase family DNA binding protein
MSVLDAAGYLSMSTRSVRRLLASGAINAYRVNRSIRVRKSEIDSYMESRRVEQVEEKRDLKAMLADISKRVLAERHRRTA